MFLRVCEPDVDYEKDLAEGLCYTVHLRYSEDMSTSSPASTAIYCRISQDITGEAEGVARQEQACREWAERQGWKVSQVYIDNDQSAFRDKHREAWSRLLEALHRGDHDGVLAYDIDRLGRGDDARFYLAKALEASGALIATVKDGVFDLSTTSGAMMFDLKFSIAKTEVRQKGTRHLDANMSARKAGRSLAKERPFGYSDRMMSSHDPVEATAIQTACADILAGKTLRDIAREWTARGIHTKTFERKVRGLESKRALLADHMRIAQSILDQTEDDTDPVLMEHVSRIKALESEIQSLERDVLERGLPGGDVWTSESVRHVILNPRIAGVQTYMTPERVLQKLPEVRVLWTPIVTTQTQEEVRAALSATRRSREGRGAGERGDYLLSGILVCGKCGSKMIGGSGRKGKDGSRLTRYICTAKTERCWVSVRTSMADRKVLRHVVLSAFYLSPEKVMDVETLSESRTIAEGLSSIDGERNELAASGLKTSSLIPMMKALDERENTLAKRLEDLTASNALYGVLEKVSPALSPIKTKPGFKSDAFTRIKELGVRVDDLTASQKRLIIEAMGTYTVVPQGHGKAAEIAIEPSELATVDLDDTEYPD